MRTNNFRRKWPLVPLLLASLASAGSCESGGRTEPDVAVSITVTPTTASEVVARPTPDESINETLKRFNHVLAAQDCETFHEEFDVFAVIFDQGQPCTKKGALGLMTEAKLTEAQEYGTAAVAQDPGSGGAVDSVAVFVLYDSRFRFLLTPETGADGQIGTNPPPGANARANAEEFLEGVKEGDCTKVVPVLNPDATLAASFQGDLDLGCQSVVDGVLFAPSLRETPGARLETLGQTKDFAFFGVATRNAYFTIILGTAPDGADSEMRVIDVLPSTPV